jgi:hypothetical protein
MNGNRNRKQYSKDCLWFTRFGAKSQEKKPPCGGRVRHVFARGATPRALSLAVLRHSKQLRSFHANRAIA